VNSKGRSRESFDRGEAGGENVLHAKLRPTDARDPWALERHGAHVFCQTVQTDPRGRLEKTLGVVFLLAAAGIVSGFVSQFFSGPRYQATAEVAMEAATSGGGTGKTNAEAVAEVPSPFPPEPPTGWQAPQRASRYTPDNLYIKINGRADIYLQFRVVSLVFGSYAHALDSKRTIDIYWYDMGQPENAQGIYRAEAPPDADKVDIGREGYQAAEQCSSSGGRATCRCCPPDRTRRTARRPPRLLKVSRG